MEIRNYEKFQVKKAKTERYMNSAVMNMKRMLNEEENVNVKMYKNVVAPVQRTCGSLESISFQKFTYK